MSESTTEVWFRNPHNYIKELVSVPNARLIAWDRGMLVKKSIDPFAHGNLFLGKNPDWRALIIGEQGTAEIDFEHPMSKPKAVYPTWIYGEDSLEDLENMIRSPLGESRSACSAVGEVDEVPVFGHEHRVILTSLPSTNLGLTKSLLRNIREIREDYEHLNPIVHLHATYAYAQMFALGLGSTDIDPRTVAAHGRFLIPPGKNIRAERAHTVTHWVNLLDMTPHDLKKPANRCIYNIKSALWAGEHWTTDVKFKTSSRINLDPRDPVIQDNRGTRVILGGLHNEERPGDKVICNSCSLQDKCKYYREDSVCTVPGSEVSPLADYFKSRNADTIIDALGTVLSAQATRVERGVAQEEDYGELDPHVSKMVNDLFNNGTKLAKLLNPNLGGTKVQVNIGPGAAVNDSQNMNTKAVMARAVKAIQDETGMALEDITPDLIVSMLARMNNQPALEQ